MDEIYYPYQTPFVNSDPMNVNERAISQAMTMSIVQSIMILGSFWALASVLDSQSVVLVGLGFEP